MNRKHISRVFVCGLFAAAVGLGCAGGSASSKSGKYTPGTYTGTGKGMDGNVTAEITVDANSITNVKLDVSGETKGIGADAGEELTKQIMDKQSADIDGVSGATITSNGIKDAVTDALNQASGTSSASNLNIKDGTYEGTATGHGGPLTVSVTVKDNKITDVKVTDNSESPNVADYVMTHIPEEIVSQQTLGVDTVSGATVTSNAVLTAVANAIDTAGGDSTSWKAQPYTPSSQSAEDIDTELVVAGGGIGGLSTAAFAAENGVKVTVIEKNDQVGGSFRYSAGGFAVANSEAMKKQGADDSLDKIMNWVHHLNDDYDATNPIDEDFVQYLLSESGKTFDDLLDMTGNDVAFVLPEPYIHTGFGNGAYSADALAKVITDHGGTIITGTTVTKIDMDGDKAVGVEAKNSAGTFKVTADNVVIATGGASYDKDDLMNKVTPSMANVHLYNEANVGNTGDGYDMLEEVGAVFDDHDVYKNGFLDFADPLFITWANQPDVSKSIIFDADGKRVYSEAPFDQGMLTTKMFEDGSDAYYILYDAKNMDPDFKAKLDALDEDPDTYVKADSISEIADKLSIDKDALQNTFDTYQSYCNAGVDKDFGKDASNLQKFDGSDGYYAVYTMPGSWGTMGGVKINRNMQVEKSNGVYYDNLYAVGEMSTGDLFSEYYMGGFSLSYYATEGRLVGEKIASEE